MKRDPHLMGFPHVVASLDGRVQHVHLRDAARLSLEFGAPVRSFPAWPGKRYYEGRYWSATTGQHVAFESLYEKTALMVLDRDPAVVGISSQPMWLRWPDGSAMRSHAPDFFVRLASGDGVVIDVRPAERIDAKTAEVFTTTHRLCAEAGWGYRVLSELEAPLARNLQFLSRFRVDGFRPPQEQFRRLDGGASITLSELAGRFEAESATAMGWIYWLIWWGVVDVDLGAPLSTGRRVERIVSVVDPDRLSQEGTSVVARGPRGRSSVGTRVTLPCELDPDAFLSDRVGPHNYDSAKWLCAQCPMATRAACLAYALENDERFGVWGGMSPRERRSIAARRATVTGTGRE